MADDKQGPGLRLVSDRAKAWEFESLDRFTQRTRYRPRALAPWHPKRKKPSGPMRRAEEGAKLTLGWEAM
jgi:hypothetical protein